MLPIPTAPVTAASEAAPRGQTLLRRAQASPWVSFLESGRVVLGVMVGDVMEHQLGVLVRGRAGWRPLPPWCCGACQWS